MLIHDLRVFSTLIPNPKNIFLKPIVVKNAQDQTTFSREFASANELGGSELYLSPPILLSSSPFPLFVVYSMIVGGWTYGRHVFQLTPGGKLKAIASMEIDVRGTPCL